MTRVFFSADCHFDHTNIIKYCRRPFKNIEHMNETIVSNWNNDVKQDDLVYHVGDFAYRGQKNARYWENRLNGSIVHIRGNHDCFSMDTEILTGDGWKKYKDVKIGELIPTVNKEKNIVEYMPILNKTISFFNNAFVWHTRTSEGIVSANHNMIYLMNKDANINKERTWSKSKAGDIWNNKSRLIIPSSFISGNFNYPIHDSLLKLLGWIYTDGSISKRGYICIWQSKSENISHIHSLFDDLDIKFNDKIVSKTRKKQFNKYGYEIIERQIPHKISISAKDSKRIIKVLKIKTNRDIPQWLHKLSDRQMKVLMNEMIKGDGHIQNSKTKVLWGNPVFLSNIQGLFITHDIDCNLVQQKTRGDNFYLSIHVDRKHKQFKAEYGVRYIYPNKRYLVDYNDFMWDVTVNNHNIFVRLNGKPYVTGNSNNGVKTLLDKCMMFFGGCDVYVSHYPPEVAVFSDFCICAHVHEKWKYKIIDDNYILINVGVDVWDFKPVKMENILKFYNKIKKKEVME